MWYSYHKTTTHNDADCRATPANGLNGNAHFAQVRPPSVPGICSPWDLPMGDDSDEKPCILFLAREIKPAAKPAKAQVEEKGARPFGPVSTAATEGWRTRPWPFTPRAGQAISIGGPVAKETFGVANDEEPVEKALMASSSVAATSEDSANNNLATLMAPTESFPGEVREPLSGGASTPLSRRASTPCGVRANDEEPVEKALMTSSSIAVTSEDSTNSYLSTLAAAAECLLGEVRERLSGGASTPSGVRASPETARPSPAPVPAPARTGAVIRNNRIHRPQAVTRRAATELTGAVTRYRGVRPNNINNNNHAAWAERFQSSTLHKLRQLGRYTNTGSRDTAYQLDTEAVPAKAAYTRTNT